VPVLQLLCSTRAVDQWQRNSIGLGPLDLSLQVPYPKLDWAASPRGVGAFSKSFACARSGADHGPLYGYRPGSERLDWIAQLACGPGGALRRRPPAQKRVALYSANLTQPQQSGGAKWGGARHPASRP